jgi:hypothetical protein
MWFVPNAALDFVVSNYRPSPAKAVSTAVRHAILPSKCLTVVCLPPDNWAVHESHARLERLCAIQFVGLRRPRGASPGSIPHHQRCDAADVTDRDGTADRGCEARALHQRPEQVDWRKRNAVYFGLVPFNRSVCRSQHRHGASRAPAAFGPKFHFELDLRAGQRNSLPATAGI